MNAADDDAALTNLENQFTREAALKQVNRARLHPREVPTDQLEADNRNYHNNEAGNLGVGANTNVADATARRQAVINDINAKRQENKKQSAIARVEAF